jgi:hypothetical protein
MEKSAAVYLRPLQDGADITADGIEAFIEVDKAGADEQLRAAVEPYIERIMPVVVLLKSRRESFKQVLVVPDSVVARISKR